MFAGGRSRTDIVPVAILLGGRGTRLGLVDRPKPMVDFLGAPLLERMVRQLAEQGFTELVFLTGHMSHVIRDHFGDGRAFGVSITYCHEEVPLGTARATRAAAAALGDEFLLLYGDVAEEIDFGRFLERARHLGGAGTLFVHPNDHPYDSDLVVADPETHRIRAFLDKPHAADLLARNLVNAGLYYLRPAIFAAIPAGDALFDWGRDVFPQAVRDGFELYAYRSAEYMKDVGTPKRLAKAEGDVRSGLVSARSMRHPQRAVFLDRDGVINREIDGVGCPEDVEILPGVAETIARINRSPLLAIAITNQPGLAKGFFSFDDLDRVHAQMDGLLAEGGGFLDDLYFCPHHPETGFDGEVAALKIPCTCRKPAPGMLLQAAADYNIDLSRSVMIGDRPSDLKAGRAAGTRTILIHRNTADTLPDDACDTAEADVVVRDLGAAWEWIEKEMLT